MTARTPQIDELARVPDGPGRVALLRGILGDCAEAPETASGVLKQLAAVLGEGWPPAVLRALRGVVPRARPRLLIALAPWLDPPLAREALDLVGLFDAPLDVEEAFRALAPQLGSAPVVALLRVLRGVEAPPVQARLLCAVAAHADDPERGALLAAAARVARRTASEPERLAAAVEVACAAGGEEVRATWDMVAQTRRRDIRLRLLAALAPLLAEKLPERLVRLRAPITEVEAILGQAALRGEVLLDVLVQLDLELYPWTTARDQLLIQALERIRGIDLFVALDHVMPRISLPRLDGVLGRALAELDEAELAAAATRLAGLNPHRLDSMLAYAFRGLRGDTLVAALERVRRYLPPIELGSEVLVSAASTCTPAALGRVERLVGDEAASLASVVLALRRGGPVPPALLLRGLRRLDDLPAKEASALAARITARTFSEILDAEPPEVRRRAADGLFAGLMMLRWGVDERAAALAWLLPWLPVARARNALLTGIRWRQGGAAVLERMLAGRTDGEAAEILATLGASRSPPITAAVDHRIANLDPGVALALASRLLRAESRVHAVRRRLDLLARRLPATRAEALRGDPTHDAARLVAFLRRVRGP